MEIWSQMGHSDVECQLPKRYLEGSFFFLMGLLVSEQILFSINPDLWCNNPCARCNQWISDPVSPWVFAGIQRSQLLAEHVLCQVSFSGWGHEAVGRNPPTKDTKPTRPWKEATPRCFPRMRLFRITTEPETSIFINFDKATQRDVRQVGWFFVAGFFEAGTRVG